MYQLHAELRSSGLGNPTLDALALEKRIERSLNRIERVVAVYSGQIFNCLGNGFQIVFDTADAAVLAACEMQHRCAALPQLSGHKLVLNIGIHQGIQLKRAIDGADSTIEIAALLAEVDDGIVTTELVVSALTPELRSLARPLNTQEPLITAHRIDWRQEISSGAYGGKTTWPTRVTRTRSGLYLTLRYKLNVLELSQEKPLLTIGRDQQNDLVLVGSQISRKHCWIQKRSTGLVLCDQSSNGTFVIPDKGTALHVLQREFPLAGKGMFFCGRKFDGERRGGIAYEVSN